MGRRVRRSPRDSLIGRAVAELNAAVRDGRDRVDILDRVCARARAITGALAVIVLAVEPDGVLAVRGVAGRATAWRRGARIPVDHTLAGKALRHQRPVSAGLRRCRYGHEQALAAAGLRRVLYLPIPGYGSVRGVLGIGYRSERPATAGEIELLEPLAAVAGLIPPDPSTAAGGPERGPQRASLQTLVDRVVTLTGSIDCAVYLPDGRLTFTATVASTKIPAGAPTPGGLSTPAGVEPGGLSTPAGPSTPAGVEPGGRGPVDPLTLAQLIAERRPSTLWSLPGGAVLCVPLVIGGVLLGALCARWPPAREPGPAERMLVNLAAGQAAFAVDRGLRRPGAEERGAAGERERLARELHDSVVQTLYGISLGAGTAGELVHRDPAQAQQSIAWIRDTAAAGLTDLRGMILRLRPAELVGNGLTTALHRLLETLHTLHGCRTTTQLGAEPPTSPAVRQALYRIAQEAVQNTAKHARAGQVNLRLFSRGGWVVMEITDDGRGFATDIEMPGRLGLSFMRERAEAAGGRLDVITAPGRGTVVRAALPASV